MSGSILYYCHNWVHQLLIGYSLVKLLHGWLGTIVTRNIFSKQTLYPSFPWNYCGLAASYSFIKIVPCCINQICCVSLGFFVLKMWFLLTQEWRWSFLYDYPNECLLKVSSHHSLWLLVFGVLDPKRQLLTVFVAFWEGVILSAKFTTSRLSLFRVFWTYCTNKPFLYGNWTVR